MPKTNDFLEISMQDLAEDLRFFMFASVSMVQKLRLLQKRIQTDSRSFSEATKQVILPAFESTLESYQTLISELEDEQQRTAIAFESYERQLALKRRAIDELRTLQNISAGILSSADWQSPTFDHAVMSRAGSQTGKIDGTYNDYTRDHHAHAEVFEKKFARAYVDGMLSPVITVCATSSGMSAFTTAVSCVQRDLKPENVILAGIGTYFQNKKVLLQQFGNQVQWFDEMDIDGLVQLVQTVKPNAIFLDTLSNTSDMLFPNVALIMEKVSRVLTQSTYLVLDNSCRSVAFQPLKHLPSFSKFQLLVVESLNKYAQFGFDRVTGGVVWTTPVYGGVVSYTRMHLGTNIPDASALALVEPNRELLDARLARIDRNVRYVAESLEKHLENNPFTKISRIVYPRLSSHPSYQWAKDELFCGGYFMFEFKAEYADVKHYDVFLSSIMSLAKKRNIDLVMGTSFGFDHSRIYLTARFANKECQPFIRVSVGTETREELEALKELFVDAIGG